MNIAILGATSFIAKELIRVWVSTNKCHEIHLYARNVHHLKEFVTELDAKRVLLVEKELCEFKHDYNYDAVINFIGVGDPAKAQSMSKTIMDVTFQYDDLVLQYMDQHRSCKYIFLSSGAVYGSDFNSPASSSKKAIFDVNLLNDAEAYGLAKFITEIKHRNRTDLSIIDLRVFNFFSKNQDLSSRFFIADLLRSIINSNTCDVSPEPMIRDYLHPEDFCQIIDCILSYGHLNLAADCYSLAPVDKLTILTELENAYNLKWRFASDVDIVRATGSKSNYYSENYVLSSLGYEPKYSSIETIKTEFGKVLSSN